MSELFSVRSLLYWWGLLSATVFVRDWLKQFADFVRTSNTFTADKIPFNILPGLDSWIDGAAAFIRDSIKFKPNDPLFGVGTVSIPSWTIAILFGVILLIGTAMLYLRALNSTTWFDDIVVLIVMYIVLRIIGHTVAISGLPVVSSLKIFVDNPISAYIVMMILMLVMTFFGEGLRSKRAFWTAIVEAFLVSLFMYPREAAIVLGYFVDALAQFGAGLASPQNVPFAVAWGLIGMILALQRLAFSESSGSGRGGSASARMSD
jgi:hypothetical protein